MEFELADVRAACRRSLGAIGDRGPDRIVVLGPADRSGAHGPLARGTLAAFGLDREFQLGSPGAGDEPDLPPSLTVAAWLLGVVLGPRNGATAFSVGPDFATSRAARQLVELTQSGSVGLLVMGDGSARRSERAPGYLDSRAEAFDAQVLAALSAGDGAALSGLDPQLGAELLAAGTPAWRAAGTLLAGFEYTAEVDYAGDPFGVGYFVAHWLGR